MYMHAQILNVIIVNPQAGIHLAVYKCPNQDEKEQNA